jgi:hypothetical protein
VERQVTVQATSSHFAAFLLEPTTGAFFRYLRQLALGVAGGGDRSGRSGIRRPGDDLLLAAADLIFGFFDGIVWENLPDAGHDAAWCGCWRAIRVVWTMHPHGKSLERPDRERRAIAAWFAGTRIR